MVGDTCNIATSMDNGILLCGFFISGFYSPEKYFWIYKKIEELVSDEKWDLQYEFSTEGYLLKFDIWTTHQITVKSGIGKKIWKALVNKYDFYPGE